MLARAHRFLGQQSFYPLALSTLLGIAFLAGRFYMARHLTYAFLLWNVLLAWIPYLASLCVLVLYQRGRKRLWLVPAAVWLVFLPNAPYMVTDLLHLGERLPIPLWYDIGLLTTFALAGLCLAFASLRTIQTVIQQSVGAAAGWLCALAAIGLSGFGIYLGRFLKFNSWDVLTQPDDVALVIARRMLYPQLQTYGVTLMFAAIVFVFYLVFMSARGRLESTEPHR